MANDPELRVPPKGTRQNGEALWYSTLARYKFQQHELMMLREAVRTVDQLDRLSDAIAHSRTITPTGGVHPAITEARQLRITLTAILTFLQLPTGNEDTEDTSVSVDHLQQRPLLSSVPALVDPNGRHRQERIGAQHIRHTAP
jgi:hypothetical protein